ncbi:cytochrome P450 2 sub U member 1 [Branchiostoma belcheri]|nr:cytochrome P450 2 sub U member 1 [Branchiostoma belcheri]
MRPQRYVKHAIRARSCSALWRHKGEGLQQGGEKQEQLHPGQLLPDAHTSTINGLPSVQQELDAVVGEGLPALSHRSQLPYVNACLLEVMRIRPIGPLLIPRATTQTVKGQEYEIPSGPQVLSNLYSLHMDPAYWPDPDRFDPRRFLDSEGNVINNPESFMPFGGGRRVCIGEQLSRMELFLFFSTLLQSFTFMTPEGATTPSTDGVFHITLRPHPFKLCAIPHRMLMTDK